MLRKVKRRAWYPSDTEKQLLSKDLNFIPKPKKMDIRAVHTDIQTFKNSMKTKYEMHKKRNKL